MINDLRSEKLVPYRTNLEYIGYRIQQLNQLTKVMIVSTRWMIIGRSSSKLYAASVLRLAHVYGGIWWVGHRLRWHMLIIYGSSILGCMTVLRILGSLLLLRLVKLLLRLVTMRVWEIEGGRRH